MSTNPYTSPTAHPSDDKAPMSEYVFRPHFAARDLKDGLITAAIFPIQMAMLFGLPALLGFLASRSAGVALLCGAGVWGLFCLLIVRELSIDASGIRFQRRLGWPRSLTWAEIDSVREVSRSELIVHGWIWPILPAREMSNSLSSLGHFRIQYGFRWVYFPPADRERFLTTVQKYLR